jgi:hypothetical protein
MLFVSCSFQLECDPMRCRVKAQKRPCSCCCQELANTSRSLLPGRSHKGQVSRREQCKWIEFPGPARETSLGFPWTRLCAD